MTTNQITKAVNIDNKKFKIAESIKVNKYNGKSVFASYNGASMRVQLPKMGLPFGISKYTNPDNGEIKYSLDLSMKGVSQEIFDNFKSIEDVILEYAEKNSVELFKKKRTKEILKEFYKPFIKFHEEDGEISDKYPARFKAKMWLNGNDFSTDVYDSEKVDGKYPKIKMTVDNGDEIVAPGSSAETIVQCSGLWVVGDSFGVSWSVVQMKLYKNANVISGYAFEDDAEEEVVEVVDIEEPSEFVEEPSEFDEEPGIKVQEVTKRVRRKRDEL